MKTQYLKIQLTHRTADGEFEESSNAATPPD
jgi:hypothetical protein